MMLKSLTKENQYSKYLQEAEDEGFERLGLMHSQSWRKDPKHLLFTLSRYKFVAKMFDGFDHVLEVGCGDGFACRIVHQHVKNLDVTDFDPVFIKDIENRTRGTRWAPRAFAHDILGKPIPGKYDGIYALDVLEHIHKNNEFLFLKNMIAPLTSHGTVIIGMPSIESEAYASEDSKQGHINLKSQKELKMALEPFFHTVFMFSMNDEVVHTGFYGMAHYIFAVCCGKK